MTSNAVIYARSSPDCAVSAEDQVDRLNAIAADHGWTVVNVFVEHQATAKKDRRPAEMALLEAVQSGTVNRVLLWSVDRIGRSLIDLVRLLETCRGAGVALYFHEQRIDSTTSNGVSLFDFGSMMAYHLRQSRRDRILRGQAAVRGLVRFGRPPMPPSKIEKAKSALMAGKGIRETARLAGVSAASVSRLKSELHSAVA